MCYSYQTQFRSLPDPLTDSITFTHSCLVDLTDVTLAVEYKNLILDVDAVVVFDTLVF